MIENLGLYDIVIDLKNISRYTNSTNIYYKEGDINTAKIRARLKNKDININLIGVTVFIKIETPISKIEDEVTVIDAENGIIEYTFSTNALVQGANFFELILIKDGNVKVSQRLAYKVLDSIDDGDIESTNEYPILIQLISKAEKLIEDNESIKLNESIRIADEDTRKSNETKRQTNESTRESQEITRQQSITNMQNQFNALAPTESTNAEVQLARTDIMGKTHDSLQERLISDNKAQNTLFEEVNGSHISADTTEGYINDLVIEGCTIQDENNLSDIRSVGDKVEGQELYKIPLLCTGKNLCPYVELGGIDNATGIDNNYATTRTDYCRIKSNTSYILSRNGVSRGANIFYYDINKKFISKDATVKPNFTAPSNCAYVRFYFGSSLEDNIQLEEGTVVTPYEPYQEHKLTILSPTQIEKVGDVSDRIIEKDGVWGVEKNNVNFNVQSNVIHWGASDELPNSKKHTIGVKDFIGATDIKLSPDTLTLANIISDKFKTKKVHDIILIDEESIGVSTTTLSIRINNNKLTSPDSKGLNEYITKEGLKLLYTSTKPKFIPLPNSQQVLLRTLPNKTNISFLTEIEGTIKGKVPKSLSATVNTHTTQIDNLNTDLERVKKLEESTVSTVKNDGKYFVSVESTNQGYFEDVRLDGKTLVNLSPNTNINYTAQSNYDGYYFIGQSNANVEHISNGYMVQDLEPDTDYTLICNIINIGDTGSYDLNNANITTVFDEHINVTSKDKGLFVKKLKSRKIFDSNITIALRCQNYNSIGLVNITNFTIVKGDYSNKINSTFNGLKSVGEGTDEIVVSSCNENLFNPYQKISTGDEYWKYDGETFSIDSKQEYMSNMYYIPVTPNKKYFISAELDAWVRIYKGQVIGHEDGRTQLCVIDVTNTKKEFVTDNTGWITLRLSTESKLGLSYIKNIMLSELNSEYIPHKSNKKPLLRYNDTTQIWEKPILREWDYVEKRSDGEYYNVEKSGQVVLNGSENWNVYGTDVNTVGLSYNLLAKPMSEGICDIIPFIKTGAGDKLHCMINNSGILLLWIEKNKLETQDVAGFKKWLQTNPVTVTYQLATPKEYKCTNIDLISYPNETNLYINSGAITPNLTAKYHGNIANSMIILQNKVSLLENKFMNGLKSVLAGNMQDLAYSLYPNDFNMSTTLEL